jgi:hypothetical protein
MTKTQALSDPNRPKTLAAAIERIKQLTEQPKGGCPVPIKPGTLPKSNKDPTRPGSPGTMKSARGDQVRLGARPIFDDAQFAGWPAGSPSS